MNKQKIGLLNLQYIDNYGANLISYAMESVCNELSPENNTSTINYTIDEQIVYSESSKFKNLRLLYGFKKALSIKFKRIYKTIKFFCLNNKYIRPLKEFFKKKCGIESIVAKPNPNIPLQDERLVNFQKYRDKYLNLSKLYHDESFMNDGYDTIVVGSDVVWKPQRLLSEFASKVFFLKSPQKINRIAYAASLGISDIKQMNRLRNRYKKSIEHFSAVSIREYSGTEYIQSLFPNKKIYNCIDPVFLCSAQEYEKLINTTNNEEKFIYAYILGRNPDAIRFVEQIAEEKGLKIFYHSNSKFKNGVNTYSDGPCEFLERIKNAEYIITDSFHGTAFSIIFKKQFYSFTRGVLSVRLENFMSKIGLKERLLTSVDENTNIDNEIPYEEVWNYLNKWINDSKQFLKDAIYAEEKNENSSNNAD